MAWKEKRVKTRSEDWNGRDKLGDRTLNGIVTEYTIPFIGQMGSPGLFKRKDVEYGYLGLTWLRLQAGEADYCEHSKTLLVAYKLGAFID